MFLLQAIYFKGDWKTPFPETATSMQPFRLESVLELRDAGCAESDGDADGIQPFARRPVRHGGRSAQSVYLQRHSNYSKPL
ncbi:serpin family protein [Paenibacillus thermoaerophilus]|uniref:serpin family protein n=1 Tax=Paenibacillus thermoaerophilus TaxID=1215385 RepID=UPI003CCC8090